MMCSKQQTGAQSQSYYDISFGESDYDRAVLTKNSKSKNSD